MKKFLLFTLIMMLGMTSCTTTYHVSRQPEISNLMIGHSHKSGTILIYEETTSDSMATAYDVNYFTGTYTPGFRTTSHTEYVHVYINPQGKCYDVKTNLTREETVFDSAGTILSIASGIVGIIILSCI